MSRYVLGLDQSTQGTKLLLFGASGEILWKRALPHAQHVDARGWVEHDPEEIYQNVCALVRELRAERGVSAREIAALGISNQRETAIAWDRGTGKPLYHAIVWQCARGEAICKAVERQGLAPRVRELSGLPLSPYFSAAKLAWILQHVPAAKERLKEGRLCMGTVDAYLVFRLTGGIFRTDASNASRTQLMDLARCAWSEELCAAFGIPASVLPDIADSDACYGETSFDGALDGEIPIYAVMGDSHAALFGQGCHRAGMAKATYGTGSSVMMHVGDAPIKSAGGLAGSVAWRRGGRTEYVLEGNINYTGAAITWLKEQMKLIESPDETEALARQANPADRSYFVPAFTGLGAPHWRSDATGLFTGITRVTGRAEMVRAVLDAIAFQVCDVALLMQEEAGMRLSSLRVDGGPTKNAYLMQRQSDFLGTRVEVTGAAELSAIGAAYAAGIAAGEYAETVFDSIGRTPYAPAISAARRAALQKGWQEAIARTLMRADG